MEKGKSYSNNTVNRVKWIDIIKGIGIVFVIIGHVNKDSFLINWIYTFHMPCFFALSGYLLYKSKKTTSFKKFFMKRVKSILWPFILFRILLGTYWIVVESHFRDFDMGPIWFLAVLFFVELLAFILIRLNNHINIYLYNTLICVFTAVIFLAMRMKIIEAILTPWILRTIDGLFWFLQGHLCGIVEHDIKKVTFGYMQKKVLVICLFISSLMFSYYNPGVSLWSNSYGRNYVMFIIGGIIGSIWLGLLCKWFIYENLLLEHIGQNTITLMAIHEPVKRIVLKCIEVGLKFWGFQISIFELQTNILYSMAIVIVVLVLCLACVHFLRLFKNILPEKVSSNYMTFVK